MHCAAPTVLLALAVSSAGVADDAPSADVLPDASVRYHHVTEAPQVADDPVAPAMFQDAPSTDLFGAAGSTWVYVHGGGGAAVNDSASLGFAGVGLSHFIVDDFSINAELNAMYIGQTGDDAFGGNFNLLVRWHFLHKDNWTMYIDGGAGVLLSTEDVPDDSSEFNFTPQAGAGFTYDLDNGSQLMVGARWQHISNASTSDRNPGRDHIIGYLGVMFPF